MIRDYDRDRTVMLGFVALAIAMAFLCAALGACPAGAQPVVALYGGAAYQESSVGLDGLSVELGSRIETQLYRRVKLDLLAQIGAGQTRQGVDVLPSSVRGQVLVGLPGWLAGDDGSFGAGYEVESAILGTTVPGAGGLGLASFGTRPVVSLSLSGGRYRLTWGTPDSTPLRRRYAELETAIFFGDRGVRCALRYSESESADHGGLGGGVFYARRWR